MFDTIKSKNQNGRKFCRSSFCENRWKYSFNNIGKVEKYGDIVAKYEAVYVKDTKLVFEGEFPAGVELTVNLKEVNFPYKLKHNENRKSYFKRKRWIKNLNLLLRTLKKF